MTRNIVIYQDEGVGQFGLSCVLDFFHDDKIQLADAPAVITGRAFQKTDLFVMPGGADLPYCRKLNGTGNKNIRDFVENGGLYLGICAGAYYACRDIEYHKGRADEICGKRELNLIETTAYGSLPNLAPYYDETLHSAAIVEVSTEQGLMACFYTGGCAFKTTEESLVRARYADGTPAIISSKIKKGGALLSGVHIEMTAQDLAKATVKNDSELPIRQSLAHTLLNHKKKDWRSFLEKEFETLLT